MYISDYSLFDILNNTVLLESTVFQSDIIYKDKHNIALVLGNKEEYKYRVSTAFNLYQNNIVDKILFSGSHPKVNIKTSSNESALMKEYAISLGIDKSDILIEQYSRTSFENLVNSIPIIFNSGYKKEDIVLITSDYHLKRSLELLKKLLEHYNYSLQCTSSIYPMINKENYEDTIKGNMTIKKEALLIKTLYKTNKINDYQIK